MIIKLLVGNSITKIENICNEILNFLYNLLSYENQDSFFFRKQVRAKRAFAIQQINEHGAEYVKKTQPELYRLGVQNQGVFENWLEHCCHTYLLDKTRRQFPTGLLNRVTDYFEKHSIAYEVVDNRIKPTTNQVYRKINKLPPLRYYQEEIVQKCLEKDRGIIEAATGTGKTNVIVELVYRLKNNTLIIVPSSTILNQFYNILTSTFGKNKVGMITSGKKHLNKYITIATYQSLPNIEPSWFKHVDTLIIDECHHSGADTIVDLNKTKFDSIYYRYYFSGTPFRNDGKDMSLQSVISDEFLYHYPTPQAIKDQYLVPVRFYIYDIYHQDGPKDWRSEQKDYIIENNWYNNMIAEKARNLDAKGRGVIIFVDQIKHGEYLASQIPNSRFVNGTEKRPANMESIEDFNKGKFNIMIGTTVIGEGVDTVRAQVGIIAGGGKAESSVIQKIGRLLRPFPGKDTSMVVDFTHGNTKYLNKHYEERLSIYSEFGENNITTDRSLLSSFRLPTP